MSEVNSPSARPTEEAPRAQAPVEQQPVPTASAAPPVEDTPREELSPEAWATHAGVPIAHVNHMRAVHELGADFVAKPEALVELLAAAKNARI